VRPEGAKRRLPCGQSRRGGPSQARASRLASGQGPTAAGSSDESGRARSTVGGAGREARQAGGAAGGRRESVAGAPFPPC
jgi:hypothetical protein